MKEVFEYTVTWEGHEVKMIAKEENEKTEAIILLDQKEYARGDSIEGAIEFAKFLVSWIKDTEGKTYVEGSDR